VGIVARRLVFHLSGYEPLTPEVAHQRFARELRRFERTWSATASISGAEIDADQARWRVATRGPNWHVDTEYRLVRWDDVIAAARRRSTWRRIWFGFAALCDFIASGAFWKYCRTNWRYAGFFLYPFLLLTVFAALVIVAGAIVADLLDSKLAGALVSVLGLIVLVQWPGQRLYLPLLLDDWIFSREFIRRGEPVLESRLGRIAHEIVRAVRDGNADEIAVIGHSLGAVLAIDVVHRALGLEPLVVQNGPGLVLLTIGSSIPKVGLHPGAHRFRAALAHVAATAGVFWAEYQALNDVMNFYKTDPVAALGLPETGRPVVRIVRFREMLDPARYRRIQRSFFRLHRQFVSANDRRTPYDYFMLICGPLSIESQVRWPYGAAGAIGPDGALLENPQDAAREGPPRAAAP
jgi:hypothetical protein